MPRARQKWTVGDVFTIATLDGKHVACQLVGREAEVLNSVSVAIFDQRFDAPAEAMGADLNEARAFAIVFTTRDLLDGGTWKVVAHRPVEVSPGSLPFEHTRASGWLGAEVIGSGIVVDFVNAYFGLAPWDDWHDPSFLDKLLVSPDKKPSNVRLKGR